MAYFLHPAVWAQHNMVECYGWWKETPWRKRHYLITMRQQIPNSLSRIAGLQNIMRFLLLLMLFSQLVTNTPAQQTRQRNREATSAENRLTKDEVLTAEQRLSDLGYWTGAVDGVLDSASRQAVIAFQKVERRKPTGKLTIDELALLLDAKPPLPRESDHVHIEVDLTRQILLFVENDGKVSHILPVSSGSGEEFTSEGWTRRAITSTGRFKVNNKIKGWRKSPLGLLYYPNYIYGGVAIHGNPSVPTRPASHGCIRMPMFAAVEFSRLTPIGTEVLVYETDAKEETPEPGQSTTGG